MTRREARQRKPPKKRIVEGDGDPRHGTAGGYTNHGCRCDACREANRLKQAQWRDTSPLAQVRREEARQKRLADREKWLAPHGTLAAYHRHRYHGETPCADCHEAALAKWRKGREPRELKPCGTVAGYSRHRYRGEVPCEDCYAAERWRGQLRREEKRRAQRGMGGAAGT